MLTFLARNNSLWLFEAKAHSYEVHFSMVWCMQLWQTVSCGIFESFLIYSTADTWVKFTLRNFLSNIKIVISVSTCRKETFCLQSAYQIQSCLSSLKAVYSFIQIARHCWFVCNPYKHNLVFVESCSLIDMAIVKFKCLFKIKLYFL